MTEVNFLLRTVHGSRLYGLAHAESDFDTYMVVANGTKRATQKIVGKQDVTVLTLNHFAYQIFCGVPQALEALFSPIAERAALDAYRHEFYPDTARTMHVYRRTMKHFVLGGTFKKRRHALRLALNLRDLFTYGQFNSRLQDNDAELISVMADSNPQQYADFLRSISPVDPFDNDPGRYLEELRTTW